jgi:lysophospholipase L1-like esterase
MKIVFFGDSLTWGEYGGSFFDELVKLLPEHELINAGEGGNTVINLVRRLERDVLAHNPDAVLVMVGGNDSISYNNPTTRPYYVKVQEIPDGYVSPQQFEQHYRDLLSKLQAHHVLTLVGLEPTEYSPDGVEKMREYNEIAAKVAQSFNVPVLDLLTLLLPDEVKDRPPLGIDAILTIGARLKQGWKDYETVRVRDGYTYTFDGIHLTPEGAKRAADLIAPFIREHLA